MKRTILSFPVALILLSIAGIAFGRLSEIDPKIEKGMIIDELQHRATIPEPLIQAEPKIQSWALDPESVKAFTAAKDLSTHAVQKKDSNSLENGQGTNSFKYAPATRI